MISMQEERGPNGYRVRSLVQEFGKNRDGALYQQRLDDDVTAFAVIDVTTEPMDKRDGHQTVTLAHEACELTDWTNYMYLDTLAAAFAEVGDFERAKRWQTEAIDFAPKGSKQTLRETLTLYENGVPNRQP